MKLLPDELDRGPGGSLFWRIQSQVEVEVDALVNESLSILRMGWFSDCISSKWSERWAQ